MFGETYEQLLVGVEPGVGTLQGALSDPAGDVANISLGSPQSNDLVLHWLRRPASSVRSSSSTLPAGRPVSPFSMSRIAARTAATF